ncbi:MAG: DUF885 family protein, partial [Verrucomicrobia bacterium]|nr:DUF885 family protein [Verrucomicrobiota bacterium]
MMKHLCCARGTAVLLLLTVVAQINRAADADAALDRFFRHYLEESFQQRPLEATQLGDHRFDARLDDLTPVARARWVAHTRRTLEQLPGAVAYSDLTRAGQIDYETFRQHLLRAVWLAENLHPFENDPRVYNDYVNDSVYLLLAQSTLPRETNISNVLARMAEIPRVLAAARANLQNPPPVLVDTAIRQNRGAIGFYASDIFTLAGPTRQLPELKAAAQSVVAALQAYQGFLEKDLRPRAHGDWRLGREKFYHKLELDLDAGVTADQVLADAETEFDRVRRDMYVIGRQLWSHYFPKAALPPDDTEGRNETIRRVLVEIGHDHGKPANLTRDARATVERIKRFIRAHDLLRLPEPDHCRVIEMPEFQRGNSTAFM